MGLYLGLLTDKDLPKAIKIRRDFNLDFELKEKCRAIHRYLELYKLTKKGLKWKKKKTEKHLKLK